MCTLERRGNLFILTLTGTGEHRLNPVLIDDIKALLDRVKCEAGSGSVPSSTALITTAHGNFFSNGYDLAWGQQQQKLLADNSSPMAPFLLMSSKLRSLLVELISLPMPTIAAVTGHASAAGFIFALCHDYVVMRRNRGFLYMCDLDLGLVFPHWMNAVLSCKIGSPAVRRDVALRAVKMKADEAVERGVIESAHDGAEETVEGAVCLGLELLERQWEGSAYCRIRKILLADVLEAIKFDESVGENFTKVSSRL